MANPTDRGQCGIKRHLLTDGRGVPLATIISGANRTGMQKLADLLDARAYVVATGDERHLCLDRGDDYAAWRAAYAGRAPRRGSEMLSRSPTRKQLVSSDEPP